MQSPQDAQWLVEHRGILIDKAYASDTHQLDITDITSYPRSHYREYMVKALLTLVDDRIMRVNPDNPIFIDLTPEGVQLAIDKQAQKEGQ